MTSALVVVFGELGFGSEQQADVPDKFRGMIIHAPIPEGSATEGGRIRIVTEGIYRLIINPRTGVVDEIKVIRRSAIKRLDANAVIGLSKWKFRPGTLKQIDVPVLFRGRDVWVTLKDAAGY